MISTIEYDNTINRNITSKHYIENQDSEYNLPNYEKSSIYIKGQKFYYRLKQTNPNDKGALLDDYMNIPYGTILVCYVPHYLEGDSRLYRQTSGEVVRLFTKFIDAIDLYNFMNKFQNENKCFYEVILGHHHQKIKFDIDIARDNKTDEELTTLTKGILNDIVNGISCMFKKYNMSFSLENNLVVCNSNGQDKRSFHLIIDKYWVQNNDEARQFYNETLEFVDVKYHAYIDKAVYNTIQQFRIINSTKTGANRPKVFLEKYIFDNNLITFKYDEFDYINTKVEKFRGIDTKTWYKNTRILYSTLIHYTSHPYFPIKCDNKIDKKYSKNKLNVDETFLNNIIKILDKQFANTFQILDTSNEVLHLKRLKPSKCLICKREHENENAFIFKKDNGKIYLNCRRNTKSFELVL